MVNNERIIKFPVPNWNKIISDKFDNIITCVCYQYHFDINFHGPYGFDSPTAQKIINDFIKGASFYDATDKRLCKANSINRKGLYIFPQDGTIDKEIENYAITSKKNELRKKRGLAVNDTPEKPILFNITDERKIPDSVISYLICEDIPFFIVNHYMPEAGNSILFFTEKLAECFLNHAKKRGIVVYTVETINSLKSW